MDDTETHVDNQAEFPLMVTDWQATEESDDIWLETAEVEQPASPAQEPPTENDDKSPLERLLISISSDDQWTVNEEKDQDFPTSSTRLGSKTYHDPLGELAEIETKEGDLASEHDSADKVQKEDDVESDHDSTNEVHTSRRKSLAKSSEESGVVFTAIVLFRFLFGKRRNSTKTDETFDAESHQCGHENPAAYRKASEEITNINNADIIDDEDHGDNETTLKTSTNVETAVSLPIFLLGKLLKKTLKKNRDATPKGAQCPLCGQHVVGDEEFKKRLKLWRVRGTSPNCEVAPSSPGGMYKTELRIHHDGSRSVTESFLRNTN